MSCFFLLMDCMAGIIVYSVKNYVGNTDPEVTA
jgi:hypothetical protein